MNRLAVQAACVFALACIPYLNTLDNSFHYDDFHSVVNNPHIRALGNIADFFIDAEAFSVRRENAMYRPLLAVTYSCYAASDKGTACCLSRCNSSKAEWSA